MSLAESGVLQGNRGSYQVAGPVDAIDIPASVQSVLAARIDRLSFKGRAMVQAAAVVGQQVPEIILDVVAANEQTDLRAGLHELIEAELLIEVRLEPRELAFRHAIVQEVAYKSLPKDRRRNLHARAGEAVEALALDRGGEFVEVATEHFRRGEQWERAAPLALRAARKAKETFAYDRATEFAKTALQCSERMNDGLEQAIAAQSMLGDLYGLMGERRNANKSYDRAIALSGDDDFRDALRHRYHFEHTSMRDGVRLAYYVHGTGDETIVFVHPVAYDLALFQPTIETLCDEFRLVAIDPRGNGDSDPIPSSFVFSDCVNDLKSVVEDLAVGPVHLVGQSKGASMSLKLAHQNPELVKGLVLVGIKQSRGSYSNWVDRFSESIESGDILSVAKVLNSQIFSEPEIADVADQSIRAMAKLPAETMLSFFETLPDFDARDIAPEVSVPTLVVHGDKDLNTPIEDGRHIAEIMPNAQFRPFPGRGHLPNFTARAEFCEAIAAFVRGDPVPGAEA